MSATLTDREADIMSALWDLGPSSVADVRKHLTDPLAHNTVLTMLRILEEKGFVRHEEEVAATDISPLWRYKPHASMR